MRTNGHRVINGETFYVRNGDAIHEVCCDCSLSHLVIYRIVGKRIAVTVYRDDADTHRHRNRRK